ncbi:MAG TPA: carbohydrate ABC transporter permease [Egibacteraceae bacterium]|nr:carbohydrate ABC transporter permease [Egibacteraceae bacterium]HVM14596.1 carbohydrate ABC transporter permease [Egibacteraceae bacterium]HVM21413.1 carbohydrate ABC transporter permease [Egibacteraceae bacterium]
MSQVTPAPVVDENQGYVKAKGSGITTGGAPATGRGRLFARIALFLIVAMWTIPTIGLLISSFRDPNAVRSTGWWTVLANPFDFTQWTLANYDQVLFGGGMANAFVNSLVVAIPATVIPITIAAFAAYAFSWMEFKGREVLFVIFVGLLVVPLQVAFLPLFRVYNTLGWNGTFLAVWLAHAGFGMPLAVYLFRNYMGSLPREVIESARVDGASHFQTFWRLIIPLSIPALAAYAIFQFLWTWNDLLVALVFLGGQARVEVVTLNLANLIGSQGQQWHLLTAGAFITMTVPLIVFFSLQRFFVRGLTAGSVKG